jgi:hypothetical protein
VSAQFSRIQSSKSVRPYGGPNQKKKKKEKNTSNTNTPDPITEVWYGMVMVIYLNGKKKIALEFIQWPKEFCS